MAVSREDVLEVARLARLRLSAGAVDRLTDQLNTILEHVDALGQADIDGVEPFTGSAEWAAALRSEDQAADPLERALSEFAPETREGFLTVPRLAAMDDAAAAADHGGAAGEEAGVGDNAGASDDAGGSGGQEREADGG